MAQYLRLESSWLNVDKIVRVVSQGSSEQPVFTVYCQLGEIVEVAGDDAKVLLKYLNGSPATVKR